MGYGARSGHDYPEGPEGDGRGPTPLMSDERPSPQGGETDTVGVSHTGDDGDGARDDGEAGRDRKKKQARPFWKELPLLVGIALVLALVIKTFLLQAFSIPSESMRDSLKIGDRVLVDKLTPWFGSEPERGEVVVFHDPGGWLPDIPNEQNALQKAFSFIGLMPSADEQDLIKRVIAVGGDTVSCRKGEPVKVNGAALEESYLKPGSTPCDDRPFGPVTVPKDHMWVMGDNRQNSRDSRYHQDGPDGGMVPVDEAIGRAVVVAWPLDRWATLPAPETFDQKGVAAKAAGAAPALMGVAGVAPLALWLRRRPERSDVSHRAERITTGG
ncbi:signal peptidase I [Streptomyces sp. RKND-216]|uniref:signal peptidase I n=1 Tax=Streptomyces sp. RKND-216 TaxID=2562581 RepID=UPI00109DA627|nr:signal peptidase I [Streptomyces sp. RKND-216]THA27531.1 signal peptidase I [Streptomyces sp. RKND-216]